MCGDSDPPPAAPAAPDPYATADAQYTYNSQAARDSAYLSAIDQWNPYGSTTYARRPDGTPYAQAVTLSPEVQAMLDSQFGAGTALNKAAAKQLSFLPQDKFQLPQSPGASQYATDAFGAKTLDYNNFADPLAGDMYQASAVGLGPTNSTSDIARTSYDQAKSMFAPDLEASRKAKTVELANRGIGPGDEIYNDEMSRLDRSESNAYNQASRQAILDSGTEQSRQFGQNLTSAQYGGDEQGRLQSADLANRGFLGQTQNQQYNQLKGAVGYGNDAYQQNLGNVLLERNQPLTEFAALTGATPQFQTPSFMNTAQTNVAAPDYTGVVNNNYSQQSANYRQDSANAAQPSGIWGALGSVGSAIAGPVAKSYFPSDEDLKEDRHPASGEKILAAFRDMPVDDYRYKDSAQAAFGVPERRTGAMAQDWQEHFGGDGKTIDIPDALGKIMAAMKTLDRRTAGRRA